MSSPSPEVLEKWRKELQQAMWNSETPIGLMTPVQAAQWAFNKARQTAVIELPSVDEYWAGGTLGYDGENYERAVKHAIESQGYRAEVKGE